MAYSGEVVGRCWACGRPVARVDRRILPDRSVPDRRGRPKRRLVHRGDCEARAERIIGDRGQQLSIAVPDAPRRRESRLSPRGVPFETIGPLEFYGGGHS